MDLPRTLSIAGRKYRVTRPAEEELHGWHNGDDGVMAVSRRLEGEEARKTLAHEALHAAFWESGLSHSFDEVEEETLVRMLENIALPALFRIARLGYVKKS